MVALSARVGHPLTRPDAATAGTARPGLQPAQTEPLLEPARRLLGARTVVVHARLTTVLGHQADDDVSMVRAAGGLAVADRHPPALRPGVGAGETHRNHEFLTDLRPPLIRKIRFVGMQAQRAMPHVRVTRPDHAPLTVALGDLHPRTEPLARLVQEACELAGVGSI